MTFFEKHYTYPCVQVLSGFNLKRKGNSARKLKSESESNTKAGRAYASNNQLYRDYAHSYLLKRLK
ncbi:hypothetical protein OUZ56_008466 [Daphnia magna]|uniref:Uncharacterized protein n=1 Tax=Daphnia magna TaxID=35525 RepID=A0ABR0AD29_9CRUS|nr:hypothetical protein OUZ56_008466 [Daphnia magna]